jgi:single-strand DNA-binding protein
MAGETVITVVGNTTADVELRYTQSGVAVANVTIASTPRVFNKMSNEWEDGESLFLRATGWKELAEHMAATLHKGTRVIATGVLRQRSYEDKDGNKRTSIELDIEEIGPSLKYATAQVTRVQQSGTQQRNQQAARQPQQQPQQSRQPVPQRTQSAPAPQPAQDWDVDAPF